MYSLAKKISIFSVILLATILSGAKTSNRCIDEDSAPCYQDLCRTSYCLGPPQKIANAPARPLTCNGDWVVTLAGLYWRAQEDGLEYAIRNNVIGSDGFTANREMNNLIDSEVLSPHFNWDFGFKLGVGYNTPCDGWGIELLWTRFSKSTSDSACAEFEDNQTLLPIWSAIQTTNAGSAPVVFATEIKTFWKINLDLVDLELGREYWTSPRLSLRPRIGLRFTRVNQSYDIAHKGGSWLMLGNSSESYNDYVNLKNDFKGVGLLGGLDSVWHLGCGWGIYGDLAASVIYGRFSLDHRETMRLAQTPFSKVRIYRADESFKASRATIDLGLGVKWSALVCNCRYGVAASLGWESHLFFHQNQMWRVTRHGALSDTAIPNRSGENVYSQARGTLTTSGWTLRGSFAF